VGSPPGPAGDEEGRGAHRWVPAPRRVASPRSGAASRSRFGNRVVFRNSATCSCRHTLMAPGDTRSRLTSRPSARVGVQVGISTMSWLAPGRAAASAVTGPDDQRPCGRRRRGRERRAGGELCRQAPVGRPRHRPRLPRPLHPPRGPLQPSTHRDRRRARVVHVSRPTARRRGPHTHRARRVLHRPLPPARAAATLPAHPARRLPRQPHEAVPPGPVPAPAPRRARSSPGPHTHDRRADSRPDRTQSAHLSALSHRHHGDHRPLVDGPVSRRPEADGQVRPARPCRGTGRSAGAAPPGCDRPAGARRARGN